MAEAVAKNCCCFVVAGSDVSSGAAAAASISCVPARALLSPLLLLSRLLSYTYSRLLLACIAFVFCFPFLFFVVACACWLCSSSLYLA